MYALKNEIMPYAWGSHTAIAELLGRAAPSSGPEAELWMGAHPRAPSRVVVGGVERPLNRLIAEQPEGWLGQRVHERFGARLPFLLKVLAADAPLSLQAHPSPAQARAGFAREQAAGIDRDAPERNYRDENAKPELLCALTPFSALCGFRPLAEGVELLDSLSVAELLFVRRGLTQGHDGLRQAFTALMTLPDGERSLAVRATVAACRRVASAGGRFAADAQRAVTLAGLYPDDAGVISSLLLNAVTLAPGEALYLDAGQLHSYLGGVGVEIMASSDNVLRGGLTPKHVDVPELVAVLDFVPQTPRALRPRSAGLEQSYPTRADEFALSRVSVGPRDVFEVRVQGPEILLCTAGELALTGGGSVIELHRGDSALVAARDVGYAMRGNGVAFRARAGGL
jgi:mannose-6-phosphate isomerase